MHGETLKFVFSYLHCIEGRYVVIHLAGNPLYHCLLNVRYAHLHTMK
jgi:hypothetical protein